MKILVTGAKGQLGTEIRKCIERGYTELGVPSVLKSGVVADYVDIDSLDISDLGALCEAFAGKGYDAVINCAAFTNVNACETEREIAF